MKRTAITLCLALFITIANGQSKYGIRPHFLGLSFYGPKRTVQIGLFNRINTTQNLIKKYRPTPLRIQIGFTNSSASNCSNNYKIRQVGIYNWAKGISGKQIGVLNSFTTEEVFLVDSRHRIRLIFNRITCSYGDRILQ